VPLHLMCITLLELHPRKLLAVLARPRIHTFRPSEWCITFPRSVSCPLRAEGKLLHPGVTDGVRASTNFTGDRVYHEVIARTYGAVRDSAWLG